MKYLTIVAAICLCKLAAAQNMPNMPAPFTPEHAKLYKLDIKQITPDIERRKQLEVGKTKQKGCDEDGVEGVCGWAVDDPPCSY